MSSIWTIISSLLCLEDKDVPPRGPLRVPSNHAHWFYLFYERLPRNCCSRLSCLSKREYFPSRQKERTLNGRKPENLSHALTTTFYNSFFYFGVLEFRAFSLQIFPNLWSGYFLKTNILQPLCWSHFYSISGFCVWVAYSVFNEFSKLPCYKPKARTLKYFYFRLSYLPFSNNRSLRVEEPKFWETRKEYQ